MKRVMSASLLVGAGMALITFAVGWVAVPSVAAVWGAIARPEDRPGFVAMVGAGFGWGGLLLWNILAGEGGELARRAAELFGVPAAGFVALNVALPMLMAWGVATTASALRRRLRPAGPRPAASDAAPDPPRPLLRGDVEVAARRWIVHEERRQGPRPQIFILRDPDSADNELHVRPLPGLQLTTLEEVRDHAADCSSRWFRGTDGRRWEARIVLGSNERGEVRLLKLLSYEAGAVYEVPDTLRNGLGVCTEDDLREVLRGAADT